MYFRLRQMWFETFWIPLVIDYAVEQTPMLIGITQIFSNEVVNLLPTLKYQVTILMQSDVLQRKVQKVTDKLLLKELQFFKLPFDESMKNFVCVFILHLTSKVIFISDS